MIKAVLFDLDGTLYDRDVAVHELVAAQHAVFAAELPAVSREDFVAGVLAMDDHGYGDKAAGYERLVAGWQGAPGLAARLVAHFWMHYDEHCRLSQDTHATLQTLKAHGKRLGVITNGATDRQQRKLAALGLMNVFDAVLISEAEGVRKPSVEIFRRALALCGVGAREAAFVGDHPEVDVEGARNAGLLPIWKYVSYWSPAPDGTATVHRLVDILPICLRD